MKKVFFFFALTAAIFSSCSESGSSAEQAATADSTGTKKFYGAEFDLAGAIDVASIPAKMDSLDSMEVVISGKIVETCAKAGCWMTVDLGAGEPMWVYTDHEFFVPTEGCAGLPAVIKGIARKEIQTVDEQKHYAEDANKSPEEIAAITEPKSIYSIDAVGIMIDGYMGKEGEHDHEGHDHDHDHDHDHAEGETKTEESQH